MAQTERRKWKGPYLKDLLADPWGNKFQYEFPGERSGIETRPAIWSFGADGKDLTDDDIANWAIGGEQPSEEERQIESLLDEWKKLPPGSDKSQTIAKQIGTLHQTLLQQHKPLTENWRRVWTRLARVSWPFLAKPIPQPMAQTIADLTKPYSAIRVSDRLAKDGRPTEPLGWDVQAVHALALARAGKVDEALEENQTLLKKIEVNVLKGRLLEVQLEFLGKTRSQKSLLKQTLLQKALILAIAGKTSESLDASATAERVELNNTATQADKLAIQAMLRMLATP